MTQMHEASDIKTLWRTDRCIVINKPAGMLSVPGRGPDKQDCAAVRVRALVPNATGPLVVHRLDMETSGVMLFALDAAAQRNLSEQFAQRRVGKTYEAILAGAVTHDAGVVKLRMRLDVDNRPHQIVDPVQGKLSTTCWRVLQRWKEDGEYRTRMRFNPVTGRSHQLRVHAAVSTGVGGLGAPIIGDSLYAPAHIATASSRMLLHATELMFDDPASGERICVQSQTPY